MIDTDLIRYALHAAPLVGLMLATFCRMRHTNCRTITSIRLSFWLLFGASGLMLILPAAHNLWPDWCPTVYRPSWPVILFLWVVLALQFFTARHWRHGVPKHYQRGE